MIRLPTFAKDLPKNLSRISSSEISISCPWGVLAAKKYPKLADPVSACPSHFNTNLPTLCFHGWLDNANTFEKLIPIIQNQYPEMEFVSFDWPGHGKSSHRPDGVYLSSMTLVKEIYRIAHHLNLLESGFNAIGHSMGANALMQFMYVFPNVVKSAVIIEGDGFGYEPLELFPGKIQKSVVAQVKYDVDRMSENPKPPNLYTRKQAVKRLTRGTYFDDLQKFLSSYDNEAAEILCERGLVPAGQQNEAGEDLFTNARDVKLIMPTVPIWNDENVHEVLKQSSKKVNSHILHLMANDNLWGNVYQGRYLRAVLKKLESVILNESLTETQKLEAKQAILKNINNKINDPWQYYVKNENYILNCIEGTHHLHLTSSDLVGQVVLDWVENGGDKSHHISSGQEFADCRMSSENKGLLEKIRNLCA